MLHALFEPLSGYGVIIFVENRIIKCAMNFHGFQETQHIFFYFGKVRTVLNYFFRSVICIEISGTTHLSEQFLYGRNGILIFTGD